MPFQKGNTYGRRFQKGQSGNPAGRPSAKSRKLSAELADFARAKSQKQLNALMWQYVTEGKVTFPEGHTVKAESLTQWLAGVRWLYEHLDGKHPIPSDEDRTITVIYEEPPSNDE